MLIDPVTVIAQIVNFLVLVAVLKFVLYDRIVAVIDERQARIRATIEAAEQREQAAGAEERRFVHLRRELDEHREDVLAEATRQAGEERQQLVDETREEIDDLRARWLDGVARERGRLLAELERHAARELVAISERALKDLADARLEEQVVRAGLERLHERRAELARAGTVTVATAFEPTPRLRATLLEEVRALVPGVDIDLAVDPALLCGIEVRVGDHAFGWTVGGYLEALRRRVEAYLTEELRGEDPAAFGGPR